MKKVTLAGLIAITLMAVNVFAGEVSYTSGIKQIVEERCMSCHGTDAPEYKEFKKDKKKYIAMNMGPRMDSYTYMLYFIGWPDTGAMMRRLDDGSNTESGKPGNMYKNLGDTEEERQANLAVFKKWIGNWSLKRWSVSKKEDIEQMIVLY